MTVRGAIDTLDPQGNPTSTSTTSTIAESYRRYVAHESRGDVVVAAGSPAATNPAHTEERKKSERSFW